MFSDYSAPSGGFADAYSWLRPGGGPPFPASSRNARDEGAATGGLPFFGGFPVAVVALLAALCVSAPLLQNKFGFHRLGKVAFPDDGAAASAMNFILGGDYLPVARVLQTENEGFEILSPVSYSDYTVKGGDTVSAVALRFGLNNISTVLSVNGIENARRIRSGQKLKIPSMDGIMYTVAPGDSIASVANAFNVSLSDILDANDLADSVLVAGQKLFVPGARMSSYDLRKAMGELFIYPIRGRLTSRFGTRADPFTGVRSFHTGVDLAAPTGTSVKVSTDGRVADAGWQNVFGNYVIVTHDGGYQTLYAHLSKISVRRGQYVTQGDEVGKVGSTGYSTGPHLHFSVYKNGKMIDPFSVLD